MQKKRRSGVKKELPVYCICRSNDGERFMIACDRCEEWYHGDCINVTPKQAEQIETFYCHQCRRKDSSLQINYKSTRITRPRSSRRPPSPSSSSNAYADQPSPTKSGKSKRNTLPTEDSTSQGVGKSKQECPNTPPLKSERKYTDSKVSPASIIDGFGDCTGPSSPPITYFPRNYWPRESDHFKYDEEPMPNLSHAHPPKARAASPRARTCGSCRGCTRPADCGQCDYCLDRRKFGGPNRMRQKCRLRQCIGSSASRMRHSMSQNMASRRRKQQTLHGVLLGSSSPSRLHQYADLEDEPFEVPVDFSPRPYIDHGSALYGQHPSAQALNLGSKMRRGDHRLPCNDLDGLASRSYHKLQLDAAGDAMSLLDDESDDDLGISGLQHCAGPTCMSSPIPGQRYCSDTCRIKHTTSRTGFRNAPNRMGLHLNETVIPYNLPYPDHLYCRHHRVYNWHSNGTVGTNLPSYRDIGQSFDSPFVIEEPNISDVHSHPSFPYSSGPMHHHLSQRLSGHSNTHGVNSNGRLGSLPGIGDSNDTAAFLDSVESAMRRAVDPSVDELDMELRAPQHSQNSTRLSQSPGLTSVNPYYTARGGPETVRSAVDMHHVVDTDYGLTPEVDGGVGDESGGPQTSNDYYCMMDYHGHPPNGHSSRRSLDNANEISDRRLDSIALRSRNINHRLLLPDGVPSTNGIGSSYQSARSIGMSSGAMRHTGLTATSPSVNQDASTVVPGGSTGPMSATSLANIPQHSMSSYLPGPDEFYTINDSDDLEINWPQETVAGVNT